MFLARPVSPRAPARRSDPGRRPEDCARQVPAIKAWAYVNGLRATYNLDEEKTGGPAYYQPGRKAEQSRPTVFDEPAICDGVLRQEDEGDHTGHNHCHQRAVHGVPDEGDGRR